MIYIVRVPRPVGCIFWLLVAGLVITRTISSLCDPANWHSYPKPLPANAPVAAPAQTQAANTAPPQPQDDGAPATLSVHVAANAKVYLEGRETKQQGEFRTYRTPPLPKGGEYDYEVRACWTGGKGVVDQTRHVRLRPGEETAVDFADPAPDKR